MRRILQTLLTTIGIVCAISITCFAGSWGQDGTRRFYINDDGTYAKGWNWIDDNYDGTAISYYFDDNGYLV